jgi:hypothetical protein
MDTARERDVNVITLVTRDFNSPVGFEAQANVLYDMVSANCFDGLVVWTSPLINTGGPATPNASLNSIVLYLWWLSRKVATIN